MKKQLNFIIEFLKYLVGIILLLSLFLIQYYKIPVWQAFLGKSLNEIILFNQVAAGKIVQIKGDVFRKKKDEYSFESINKNIVYLNDTILTDVNSTAVIELHNGEKLIISESSMIKLAFKTSQFDFLQITKRPEIKVLKGEVVTKSISSNTPAKHVYKSKPVINNKNLKISKVELPANFLAERPIDFDETKIKTTNFEFKKKEDEPRTIASEPIVEPTITLPKIEKIGISFKINDLTVNNNQYQKDLLSKNFKMSYHWDNLENAKYYQIIFFEKLLKKRVKDVYVKENFLTIDYIPNDYFIRLIAYDKNKIKIGDSGVVSLFYTYAPPSINYPNFKNYKLSDAKPLFISWGIKNHTSNYLISIVKNNIFSDSEEIITTDKNFIVPILNKGRYYIKVKAQNSMIESNWSSPIELEVLD